jgi:hypothetical protein
MSRARAPRGYRRGSLCQFILVQDGFVPAVGGRGVHMGVHADGVAGSGVYAQAANHATELVDLENGRALFDARIGQDCEIGAIQALCCITR